MRSNYKQLGQFIRQVDVRNVDGKEDNLLGVSVQKTCIPSIANTVGTDFTKYKVVKKGQFTYIPDTSRRGDKIGIALLEDYDEGLVSNVYTVFEIIDEHQLIPEYLMLWFSRPEFDRYARFKSHGSVREVMDWDEMCKVELPVPSYEEQLEIVESYRTISERIALKQKINDNLAETMQTLFKSWFVTFEHFANVPMQETKLGDIPQGWSVKKLTDLMDYAGGQQPPASEFIFEPKDGYVRLVQIRDYETDSYATYVPVSHKNKLCTDHDIMIARYGVSLGRICFGLNGAYNVALAKVFPHKPYYREFLRCFLNTTEFYNGINGSGERSAQQGFNQSGMDAFELAVPPDSILISFEALLEPIFERRLLLRSEISYLEHVRDSIISSIAHRSSSR